MVRSLVCVLIVTQLLALAPTATARDTVTGTAHVVDGDTLDLGEVRIRLADIDAPELAQNCEGPRDLQHCGHVAAAFLAARIEGRELTCEIRDTDDYGREIAACSHDGVDLSTWLVDAGYALAFRKYSTRLVAMEEQARARGVGLWRAVLEPPWEYRARRWSAEAQQAPAGCPIKGNVSSAGERIYHLPWDRSYSRTRIDEGKGERWFCSEREAVTAGWRPPRNR